MRPDDIPPIRRVEVADGDTRIILLVLTIPAPIPVAAPPAPARPLPVMPRWLGNRRIDLCHP